MIRKTDERNFVLLSDSRFCIGVVNPLSIKVVDGVE